MDDKAFFESARRARKWPWPLADEDILYQASRDRWTAEDAVALTLGLRPLDGFVQWARDAASPAYIPIPGTVPPPATGDAAFAWCLFDLIEDAIAAKALPDPFSPRQYIEWARSKRFPGREPLKFPSDLREAVGEATQTRFELADALNSANRRIAELEKEIKERNESIEVVNTKKLQNILKLMYSISQVKYRSTEIWTKTALAKEMSQSLNERNEYYVGEGPMSSYLQRGAELLGKRDPFRRPGMS